MRKKILMLFTYTILIISLLGCGSDATEHPEPNKTITPQPTVVGSDLFSPVEDKVVNEENVEGAQIVVEKTEETDLEKYNGFNSKMEGARSPSLFCVDGTTGITYFVNQYQDWYIYSIKDNEVTLAVELPAQELTVWDGKLYFVIYDYDLYELEGMKSGDIYVYTPETGAVEPVYAAGDKTDPNYSYNTELAVNEDGVYFRRTVGMEEKEYSGTKYNVLQTEDLYLPFDAAEPIEDKLRMTTPGWKEYRFRGGMDVEFISREEGKENIKEIGFQASKGVVMGDELFYTWGGEFGIYHLVTGENHTISVGAYVVEMLRLTEDDKSYTVQDFTITKDSIWCIVHSKFLVKINRQTEEKTCYIVEGERQFIDKLYTNGTQIFGAYVEHIAGDTTGEMVKILIDEEKEKHEFFNFSTMKVQKLVK